MKSQGNRILISFYIKSTTNNTTFDRRAKENIADADDAGAIVDAIQVRKFDWTGDGTHQRYGLIAQELLESAPQVAHQSAAQRQAQTLVTHVVGVFQPCLTAAQNLTGPMTAAQTQQYMEPVS